MPSVADFLIERLKNAGVKHIFGIPGDYSLKFVEKICNSEIDYVGCADESGAGFAADAYARVNGIGCVCVTYSVGALKAANAVACAYAERSPLIIISGGPGVKERDGMLLHHTVRSFDCQKKIFDNITCASAILDNPSTAGFEIDRLLSLLQHYKQPVYIELPRDISERPIGYDVYKQGTPASPVTDANALSECMSEIADWIRSSSRPVILAGVEVSRFRQGDALMKFAQKCNIPIAATLLSKSVVAETHPLYLGVYGGNCSQSGVQEAVEQSDCIIMLGVMNSDISIFSTSPLDRHNTISSNAIGVRVKNHTYPNVQFSDLLKHLFRLDIAPKSAAIRSQIDKEVKKFRPQKSTAVTVTRFFEKINSVLNVNTSLVADVGDCLFGATDLCIHHPNSFLGAAFYTSMGTAIPGTLGAQLANPNSRFIALVGDGAFQMSCVELSTILEKELNPVVFVLNNKGYSTERLLLDGVFNNIRNWNYHKITEMIGGGSGTVVTTEEELEIAVENAFASNSLYIINVMLDPLDTSPALKRMCNQLLPK
jgi:indolepyruvate decarboxylase